MGLQRDAVAFLSLVSDLVIVLDADLRVRGANAAVERRLGWLATALVGRPMTELVSANVVEGAGRDFRVEVGQGAAVGRGFGDTSQIIFNVGDLSYVDSAGLGEMIVSHSVATKGGGSIKLLNLGKRLQDLLVMTKLLNVFESHDSEDAAVASFARA